MALRNWYINNIPKNQWNTILTVLTNNDCSIFQYKIHNKSNTPANVMMILSKASIAQIDSPSNIVVTPQGTV